eukprot:3246936-Pyramimonas_sp.AAC.1
MAGTGGASLLASSSRGCRGQDIHVQRHFLVRIHIYIHVLPRILLRLTLTLRPYVNAAPAGMTWTLKYVRSLGVLCSYG